METSFQNARKPPPPHALSNLQSPRPEASTSTPPATVRQFNLYTPIPLSPCGLAEPSAEYMSFFEEAYLPYGHEFHDAYTSITGESSTNVTLPDPPFHDPRLQVVDDDNASLETLLEAEMDCENQDTTPPLLVLPNMLTKPHIPGHGLPQGNRR